jgi:hypothetical protein
MRFCPFLLKPHALALTTSMFIIIKKAFWVLILCFAGLSYEQNKSLNKQNKSIISAGDAASDQNFLRFFFFKKKKIVNF